MFTYVVKNNLKCRERFLFIKIIKFHTKCIIKVQLYQQRTKECNGQNISSVLLQMEMLQWVK
jgi:hypothetical protein